MILRWLNNISEDIKTAEILYMSSKDGNYYQFNTKTDVDMDFCAPENSDENRSPNLNGSI